MTTEEDSTAARPRIILAYARWTALSALRSGRHIKSRGDIYPLLDSLAWDDLLDTGAGQINAPEFATWHRRATESITTRSALTVGWAVKLINVYLKTAVYLGGLGRPGLSALLHPPIDAGLWAGVARRFGKNSAVCKRTHARTTIAGIKDYDEYLNITAGFSAAADTVGCSLIEVEQWWDGADSPAVTPSA